jgi:Spy/CpxP family protein refolding chaperone
VGSAHQWGFQAQTTGRGVQTPPQQGRGQAPPASAGQQPQGQRQPPTAEQFMGRSQWWKDDAIKKEMKLTDMQVRQISAIFDGRVKSITPWYEDWLKQTAELDRMARERTVDVSTFEIQASHVETLRSRLNETRTVMLYRIYRVLDPGQYQILQDIRDRGGRGRGGAPGPR